MPNDICRAIAVSGIWPYNACHVLSHRLPTITISVFIHPSWDAAVHSATPLNSRPINHVQRTAMSLVQ